MAHLIRFLFLTAAFFLYSGIAELHAQAKPGVKQSPTQKDIQKYNSDKDAKSRTSASKPLPAKKQAVAPANEQAVREHVILDLPGFPKYVSTGNAALDEKNYEAAKAKWMNENPQLYRQYIENARKGNPSVEERRKQNKK